jgi:hypothetical protein
LGTLEDLPNDSSGLGLKGTRWKLKGFVDVATGELTEAEPKECEGCYTILFVSDSKGCASSVMNQINLDLLEENIFGARTKIGDEHNGNAKLFYDAIFTAHSFQHESNELKIFYNDKKNYLLYKVIKL